MSEQDHGEKPPDIAPMTKARYDASVRHLQFELELFWKRSLFFWGFISAAFIAFAAAKCQAGLQAVIASFGFVCSMAWTLVNRGSKYWYENWETKLKEAETLITGVFYGRPEPEKPTWWRRKYSPSRSAVALSDYVAVLWFCLLASRIPKVVRWPLSLSWPAIRDVLVPIFLVSSVVYAVSLHWLVHSGDRK